MGPGPILGPVKGIRIQTETPTALASFERTNGWKVGPIRVNLRLAGFPLHMPARRPKADIPQAPRAFFRGEPEKVVAGACNHRELTLLPITV
jgi:hypothetical protein